MDHEEVLREMLRGERGDARKAAEYHVGQMDNEDNEHYHSNDWRSCVGCMNDNPYYQRANSS